MVKRSESDGNRDRIKATKRRNNPRFGSQMSAACADSRRRRLVTILALATVAAVTSVFVPAPAFADETRDQQWHLDALQIDKVHKLSQGEGVTIGVIDSGIDADHPDLEGNIKAGKDYGISKGKGLNDARDHGTSTTSLMVGHGHGKNNSEGVLGIAPKAKVISVGVDWDESNKGEVGEYLSDAIEWLVDEKVDLIVVGTSDYGRLGSLQHAMKKGVPVVAPAGNIEHDPYLGEVDDMAWPATDPGAVPVSGTTKDGKFWDGSVDLGFASEQPEFGVSAPAVDLTTAKSGGGYDTHDGTSGAAPLVAGTLALIKSAYPELSYFAWIDRALDTADDKGSKGYDDKYGAGIINPYRSLTEATTFKGANGDEVSKSSERLPLEEQGKDASADGEKDGRDDSSGLPGTSSSALFLTIGIAAFILLAAGVIVTIFLLKRRNKNSPPSPHAIE